MAGDWDVWTDGYLSKMWEGNAERSMTDEARACLTRCHAQGKIDPGGIFAYRCWSLHCASFRAVEVYYIRQKAPGVEKGKKKKTKRKAKKFEN